MMEISDGMASHPLTIHFREEHGGKQQEVLLRILSRHISPLERQVVELLNIIKASKISEECLNLKSEWGGSKLPDLQVLRPKGTGGGAVTVPGQIPESPEPPKRKRDKRIWSQDQEEQRPEK